MNESAHKSPTVEQKSQLEGFQLHEPRNSNAYGRIFFLTRVTIATDIYDDNWSQQLYMLSDARWGDPPGTYT